MTSYDWIGAMGVQIQTAFGAALFELSQAKGRRESGSLLQRFVNSK